MKTINLRDYYPHCREDILVDVSEEVLETILQAVRTEHTQERKARRWGTCYNSLDSCDWLEREYLTDPETPDEVITRQEEQLQVYEALTHLTPIQAKRIYDRYIAEKSCAEIADAEGVSRVTVYRAITSGLNKLKEYYVFRHWRE